MADQSIRMQGAILHVAKLSRSIDFYSTSLGFEVARRTPDAAMLLMPGGASSIAVRERPIQHYTDRTVEALVWHVSTLEALSQLATRLKGVHANRFERTVDENQFNLLSARDPDGQRLLFVHHEGIENFPQKIPAEVYWY